MKRSCKSLGSVAKISYSLSNGEMFQTLGFRQDVLRNSRDSEVDQRHYVLNIGSSCCILAS